ncbi:MAG TPA: hypothetical protein VGK99_17750 [Acidobacteriota bacterium]|jgi:hypothetical protein
MVKPKPIVQVACICERFLQEPDNVISVIRVIDVVNLKQVAIPATSPDAKPSQAMVHVMDFAIVVALKAGDLTGEFRISIVMEDPKGKRVTVMNDLPVALKGDDGVNAVVRFGLPFNAPPGRYWFDVIWDSEVLTRIPLRLKREEGEQGAALATPH